MSLKVNGLEFSVKNDILLARPMNKKDLCYLYKVPLKSLNRMLHRKPFVLRLIEIGYTPHEPILLTKKMVEMIFEHLGVIRVDDLL